MVAYFFPSKAVTLDSIKNRLGKITRKNKRNKQLMTFTDGTSVHEEKMYSLLRHATSEQGKKILMLKNLKMSTVRQVKII